MVRRNVPDYHNGYSSSFLCHTFLTTLKILALILFYWCCSISLTFFNRYLFREHKFPLSITTLHMAIKWMLAALIRWFLHRFCYSSFCVKLCGQHQNNDRERVNLTWPILWRKIAPTGLSIF